MATLGAERARPGGLGALLAVVVESTFDGYWLVDALTEAGYRVHLANTAALVQDTGLEVQRRRPATSAGCWG